MSACCGWADDADFCGGAWDSVGGPGDLDRFNFRERCVADEGRGAIVEILRFAQDDTKMGRARGLEFVPSFEAWKWRTRGALQPNP